MEKIILPITKVRGTLQVPSDKSITHRAIMLGSICDGDVEVINPLISEDTLSTINAMRSLSVEIEILENKLLIHGVGMYGLKPNGSLSNDGLLKINAGNSGTTIRLLSGILAGCDFNTMIYGDESLNKRPMARITVPLTELGANIGSKNDDDCAPLIISKGKLVGGDIRIYISSAQVKSCLMFAGLYSNSKVTITEPHKSRDHSERMLEYLGALIMKSNNTVSVFPCDKLEAKPITVPGDISSASYFMAAAAIGKNSKISLPDININETRSGIIDVLRRMNCNIEVENIREINMEPIADITVKSSDLVGTTILEEEIPRLIDELPIIAVLAAFSKGKTIVHNAKELRHKESDRIHLIVKNLERMGINIKEYDDGFEIEGLDENQTLKGAQIETMKDHRIAMAFSIAALFSETESKILDSDSIKISYPTFYEDLDKIIE
ncbi:MAG: 3-phosphoshikimate 1-carboxyvinyltransferase [Lachnospiraceae bacterium]|nr:3-phosphoshikimate 1-carboxyvinyltransferase [Lachnospiraceae bacterium]